MGRWGDGEMGRWGDGETKDNGPRTTDARRGYHEGRNGGKGRDEGRWIGSRLPPLGEFDRVFPRGPAGGGECRMNEEREQRIAEAEAIYPGLRRQLAEIESWALPPCPNCGSAETAVLLVGMTGRTIALAALSDRIQLFANRDEPGERWCRNCSRAF